MGLEDDPRVAAAKRWLQNRLDEAFRDTSFYCRSKFAEFQYPPECTGGGDPIVRQAVREFRKRSLDCISQGFSRLFKVIGALQQGAGDDLADTARNLTWNAIDETFWTAGDRKNPSKFIEWMTQAEANFGVVGGVPMVSPECDMPNSSLADQLNCDFRTQFEHRLNMLRDEAFSNIPSAQSVTLLTAASALDPNAPEPYADDQQLDSDDPETRTMARARLVRKIRKEVDYFRTALEGKTRKEIEQLALRYPRNAIFMRDADGLLLLSAKFRALWCGKKPAYAKLAFEIAGAKAGRDASVMKKAWTKHPEIRGLRGAKI
jgi:hypothetical protein